MVISMKKLFFIMMAMMASFSVYAETFEKEMTIETSARGSLIKLTEVDIVLSEITYPYVITVNVPTGRVLSVSGPCHPNIIGWHENGNVLTIPLQSRDLMDLDPGMIVRIEIHTDSGDCYYIVLNCK